LDSIDLKNENIDFINEIESYGDEFIPLDLLSSTQ
jgi:hypothetical protein